MVTTGPHQFGNFLWSNFFSFSDYRNYLTEQMYSNVRDIIIKLFKHI